MVKSRRLYGRLINDDFSKLTVMVLKPDEADSSRKGWSGRDGLMISAPAKNRSEALEVSNEFMKEYLQGYVLE